MRKQNQSPKITKNRSIFPQLAWQTASPGFPSHKLDPCSWSKLPSFPQDLPLPLCLLAEAKNNLLPSSNPSQLGQSQPSLLLLQDQGQLGMARGE